jgi:hypothetical protein
MNHKYALYVCVENLIFRAKKKKKMKIHEKKKTLQFNQINSVL